MAEVEILPEWAAHYVQDHLSEHMQVINVLPLDKGGVKGAWLLNTSKGAVLLARSTMGEVRHWFLPLPGERFTFSCQECGETMAFVEPDVPRTVFCSACGDQSFLIVEDGRLALVKDDDGRCAARTEKGDRCRRRAKAGSRFCGVHR